MPCCSAKACSLWLLAGTVIVITRRWERKLWFSLEHSGRSHAGGAVGRHDRVLLGLAVPHLHGWNLGHVLGVVLPLGAVMTGFYLWRRNLLFLVITHFLIDLPIILITLGVLPPI